MPDTISINEKVKKQTHLAKPNVIINFLDKKYNNGYHLIIDESNVSEHPQFSYLNCENEGYFTVHFIPINNDLIEFWKNYYKSYDNADSIDDINSISKKVNENLKDYHIFSNHIVQEKLEKKDGCTIESVSVKKEKKSDIYLFNQTEQNWYLLKQIKPNQLPPYLDNNFFITNFPDIFKSNVTNNIDTKIKNGQLCQLNNSSEKFNFNLTSVTTIINEDQNTNVTIQILDKNNNLLQEIKYTPQYIMSKDKPFCNSISYFNSSKKIDEGLEEYHSFIVSDFNFDGLEDFTIVNSEGSNSGPQYAYFLQDNNMNFQKNMFLTKSVGLFPSEINQKNKTLTLSNPVGCCKINTTVYKFINKNWKIISSKQEDIK